MALAGSQIISKTGYMTAPMPLCQRATVIGSSDFPSLRSAITSTAPVRADINPQTEPILISSDRGLVIMQIPINPITTALPRQTPTFSLRRNGARMVTKMAED